MKLLHYGDPEAVFDNPNVRWANPGYLLEPGDPGYVPPVPSINEPKQKLKRMTHQNYFPDSHPARVIWLAKFANALPGLATTLSLAPAVVTAIVADALWVKYILELWLPAVRAFDKAATADCKMAQSGTGSGAMTLSTFTAPALPTGVTPQAPGALNRIFALVQSIKKSGKCTDAIAETLGIVGAEVGTVDVSTVQPILTAKISGSEVAIKWGWRSWQRWLASCKIMVDRGDGHGFVLLCVDTTPNYVDTQPFPTAKTVWSYKAIYRADAAQVGQWSQVVTVVVGGYAAHN